MKISVVICTHNRLRHLGGSVVSLVSLLLVFLGLLAFRLVMPLLIERMGG